MVVQGLDGGNDVGSSEDNEPAHIRGPATPPDEVSTLAIREGHTTPSRFGVPIVTGD